MRLPPRWGFTSAGLFYAGVISFTCGMIAIELFHGYGLLAPIWLVGAAALGVIMMILGL